MCRATLTLTLALGCCLPAAAQPQFSIGHDHVEQLGSADCAWSFVQEHLDVCQFQINAVAYLAQQAELKALVDILNDQDIAISVECAYFDWESTMSEFTAPNPKGIHDVPRKVMAPGVGRATAELEIAKLAPLAAAGGTPDYIVMDGPIRRLLEPDGGPFGYAAPGLPLEQAVVELTDYMATLVAAWPEVRFVCITNFPNWAWKDYPAYRPDKQGHGDWYPCIDALVKASKAKGLPLAAIRADSPYEYCVGTVDLGWDTQAVDWLARLRDLEGYAEGAGLDFQMTINSSHGGMASARGFYRESLKSLEAYRRAGGSAALYMVHTWYPFPEALCPEDEDYTLTNLVKAVMEDFQGEPGAALARELAKPRTEAAHAVLDFRAPEEAAGNAFADYPGTGTWSCWTASGAEVPVDLGPAGAAYAPLRWNGKTGRGSGYEGVDLTGPPRILLDHVERLEMIPYTGQAVVLRWTSGVSGTVRVSGTWWMSAPGNMHLGCFLDGEPLFVRRDYRETRNPGFAFDETAAVRPGSVLEFWADANGDPRHDAARLRAVITLE